MKTDIKKLVTSKDLSIKILLSGINNSSFFNWMDAGKNQIITSTIPNPTNEQPPAWTFEEIRVMIGNDHNAPDLREPRPKPMKDEDITFITYYPHEAKNYTSGAEAAGEYLVWLIQNKHVAPAEANERYTRKFNPPIK